MARAAGPAPGRRPGSAATGRAGRTRTRRSRSTTGTSGPSSSDRAWPSTSRRRSCTCCSGPSGRCCSTPGRPPTADRFPLRATVDGLDGGLAGRPSAGRLRARSSRTATPTATTWPRIAQFADRPSTTVVGHDVEAVRAAFGALRLARPGSRPIDLGERSLDRDRIPGHHAASIAHHRPVDGLAPDRRHGLPGPALRRGPAGVRRQPGPARRPGRGHAVTRGPRLPHRADARDQGVDHPLGIPWHPDEPPLAMTVDQLRAIRDRRPPAVRPSPHGRDRRRDPVGRATDRGDPAPDRCVGWRPASAGGSARAGATALQRLGMVLLVSLLAACAGTPTGAASGESPGGSTMPIDVDPISRLPAIGVDALPPEAADDPGADRDRRPVPVPPGRRGVPEPRGAPAAAARRALPRVHGRDARLGSTAGRAASSPAPTASATTPTTTTIRSDGSLHERRSPRDALAGGCRRPRRAAGRSGRGCPGRDGQRVRRALRGAAGTRRRRPSSSISCMPG